MRRVSKGYTVLEVMIFLSVSALLIASAWSLIAGRQEQVMFDQKVRETQSKLQQWISDVSTGVTNGDPSQQTCTPQNISGKTRPLIKNTPPTSSYTPRCTFLGKAIQFTDKGPGLHLHPAQENTIYVYSVFGCRLSQCSPATTNLSQDILPTDMVSANPEPAVGQTFGATTYADLTEAFNLSPAYVYKACDSAGCPGGASHMIGFMNSFNTNHNTADNGSEDLNIYLYSLTGNQPPANDSLYGANVKQCLEGAAPCAITNNPPSLNSYQFCLTDGKYYARITISSVGGIGASTKLDYIQC